MKRYIFKRRQRSAQARKLILAGLFGGTVIMANTIPVDIPQLALYSTGATAATAPVQVIEPQSNQESTEDVYLTTGFLDGLLVDRSYEATERQTTHIPEIADDHL